MRGQFFKIDSPEQIDRRCEHLASWLKSNWPGYAIVLKPQKYVTPRSMDQNALYWVWVTEYACHLLNKTKITEEEKQAMSYTLKRHCYKETNWPFLLVDRADLFTNEKKPQAASTSDFSKHQMFDFMCWVQARAADDGLILESQGDYLTMREKAA